MRVVAVYSFKDGEKVVKKRYTALYEEVLAAIKTIDSESCKTKTSLEKTMPGRVLYSPVELNVAFKKALFPRGWKNHRVSCEYSQEYYLADYHSTASRGAFRDMDFVKDRLGVEVQFGKYAFMVYNVCAKMTIFHNLDVIDAGIEIVPVKSFADEMSTGVSYFEQFTWDLNQRGESDIDIPVLILGIDADA